MSTAAAVMIIKAPTTAAPIIVRAASVLTHFWAPGSGLSLIIALIHPLVPSGSPVQHSVLHLPPRADRTAVCGSPRFGRFKFRLLRHIRPFSSPPRPPPRVRRRMGLRPHLPHRPRTVQCLLNPAAALGFGSDESFRSGPCGETGRQDFNPPLHLETTQAGHGAEARTSTTYAEAHVADVILLADRPARAATFYRLFTKLG